MKNSLPDRIFQDSDNQSIPIQETHPPMPINHDRFTRCWDGTKSIFNRYGRPSTFGPRLTIINGLINSNPDKRPVFLRIKMNLIFYKLRSQRARQFCLPYYCHVPFP